MHFFRSAKAYFYEMKRLPACGLLLGARGKGFGAYGRPLEKSGKGLTAHGRRFARCGKGLGEDAKPLADGGKDIGARAKYLTARAKGLGAQNILCLTMVLYLFCDKGFGALWRSLCEW